MNINKILEDHIVIYLSILLLVHVSTIEAGTSSTPKNLVNLYTHSTIDNSNQTSLNQFQNEYQYRQSASKYASPDRHSTATPSSSDSIFEHLSSDLSHAETSDNSYQDNRGSTNVPVCKGRLSLNGTRGFITDGPGNYETNLQCTWFIDSGRDNATIRIQFHQFNTECNYDYLYIFDGDSIYSPLVAALSGDMKDFSMALAETRLENAISIQDNHTNSITNYTINSTASSISSNAIIPINFAESRPFELKTKSGKAFIYFHSDTAQSMPGFYLTYSINSCPLDCSNKGECDYTTLSCKCNPGYHGEGCQHILCLNNCTSPQHGVCDKEQSCICQKGFGGLDCSIKVDRQAWHSLADPANSIPPRAFHQAIVVDGIMWIIGGKIPTFSNTNAGIFRKRNTSMILSFDIEKLAWSDTIIQGMTGVDHLAELSGHSIASKGHKIFIYGGIALNNTVLDNLTVLDTKTNLITSLPSGKKTRNNDDEFIAPIAVVGHTANIIDGHMYIFLGYNPLYGYINSVQKFNLANNSWSLVEKKGSSIDGCIGHTSTYDPNSGLVYVFGGHHSHRSSNLYAFDPYSEVWTFLQSGPSPRYYHSSLIINRQLIVLGGNSYNTSYQSDQCFQQSYLVYDLSCAKPSQSELRNDSVNVTMNFICGRKCWKTVDDPHVSILKRHGHTVVRYNNALILFGGFNGILMNDIRMMNITSCESYLEESECVKTKLALNCYWDSFDAKCADQSTTSLNSATIESTIHNCTSSEIKSLQHVCATRETCTDCLNTNVDCVWSSFPSRCLYDEGKSFSIKVIRDPDLCFKDDYVRASLVGLAFGSYSQRDIPFSQDLINEIECKRLENCYLCVSRPQCSWQNDVCIYNPSSVISSSTPSLSAASQDEFNDIHGGNHIISKTSSLSNSSRFMPSRLDFINRPFLAAFTTSLLNSSPYQSACDNPCYVRRSCNECITPKCIWCSTTERCIDSSAYFAYHAMGQCMHYVAHTLKCSAASCSDIEKCDECLTNAKCGWLNDISNTGKGKCLEGTSAGPSLTDRLELAIESGNTTAMMAPTLPNWYYTSCPSCQCNGHSYCRPNSSICVQPCQDNTEGPHCERCISRYFGDPINGGFCHPCRCNGHAQSCDRETGKCYCSTKGIIGHNCNRCDDQNHYIGDPSSPVNGTCYYNLTTDYQYTFNMSKSEDHFYSYINFINVPIKKELDVEFMISCSRLALVNITSGTSYKNRKPIHTCLECGSFRLRFPHDKHLSMTETNYSYFIHVYKFQTPFILQIAFSQHRTLYMPQFFFTFSSLGLFFCALVALIWKLKHEYDSYVRRQRQFIEMEQMASRPFSTILLEMVQKSPEKTTDKPVRRPEPTPISFEPCFGSNIGVMSLFVQLPGRPNLAIGSALVTLNDDANNSSAEAISGKQLAKEDTSVLNI